jgi:hypothetical protein
MIVSRWILLRIRSVSDKSCKENQDPHFIFNNVFPENRAVYAIMCKTMIHTYRTQMTMCTHFACWKTNATDTRSEYVCNAFHCNNSYAKAPPLCYVIRTHSVPRCLWASFITDFVVVTADHTNCLMWVWIGRAGRKQGQHIPLKTQEVQKALQHYNNS